MAKIILVASGKGGVGKSTVSALLGEAFAFKKSPVLLLELDSGLRSLDVALGVSEHVLFDMGDIIRGSSSASLPANKKGCLSTTFPFLYVFPPMFSYQRISSFSLSYSA